MQPNEIITTDMARKAEYAASKVIVRVWTSVGNPNHPGQNVGHVSVQTPNRYGSLWPKQGNYPQPSAKDTEGSGIITPITHELLPDVITDEKYEGRPPELTFVFYSFDPTAIEKKIDDFRRTLRGWSLCAVCENSESCASLAWLLLEMGGIQKLVDKIDQSFISSRGSSRASFFSGKGSMSASAQGASSKTTESKGESQQSSAISIYSAELAGSFIIKSPDALGEILKEAKRKELQKHPLTESLDTAGEWRPEARSRCTIL